MYSVLLAKDSNDAASRYQYCSRLFLFSATDIFLSFFPAVVAPPRKHCKVVCVRCIISETVGSVVCYCWLAGWLPLACNFTVAQRSLIVTVPSQSLLADGTVCRRPCVRCGQLGTWHSRVGCKRGSVENGAVGFILYIQPCFQHFGNTHTTV